MTPIEKEIAGIVDGILEDYRYGRDIDKLDPFQHPDKAVVIDMIGKLLRIVYPGSSRDKAYRIYNTKHNLSMLIEDVMYNLNKQIAIALRVDRTEREARETAQELSLQFFRAIPGIRAVAQTDVEAFYDGDPAAFSTDEIIFCYPGLFAITVYRLAHVLYMLKVPMLPRIMTEHAHSVTGIDINPGATIGHRLVIDHGMGIVIGETAEIGDDCLLYQGVTLGGTGKDKGKRHPTLGNNVMVGSGAKVLGPFTVGDNARIAAGAVVLSAVPEDCTAVGVPAHVVRVAGKIATFADEVDQISVRDPVEEKLNAALSRLEFLEKLMDEQYLKSRREESAGSET